MPSRTHTTIARWAPLALAAISALAASAVAAAPDTARDIVATQAWIRALPANLPSGGYVTLRNTGATARTLTRASSPDFAEISLHQTRTIQGTSTMVPVSLIVIPAHGSVHFAPGGYHMMLEQPRRALQPGDQVAITLGFSDGSTLQIACTVRAANAADASEDMGDMPGMAH